MPFVAEFILEEPWQEPINGGLIDHWWRDLFGDEWIPWEKAERRAKFPKAYKELAPYLAHYE